MNALQGFAKLEQRMSALEKLCMGMPKVVQDFSRLSDEMKQINQACRNLIDVINKRTGELAQVDNMIITRQMALEQSLASLSKTCAAMVAELSDTQVLNQQNVMTRMRKSDEESDKSRVDKMLEQKVLKPGELITKDSLIIVSQVFTSTEGVDDVVADFRSIDMSNPDIPEETRVNYVGKQANDIVELNLEKDGGVLKTTILQVYDYVPVYAESKGEDNPKDESEQPEATPQ
jgi:hypothetical protein